MDPQTTRSSVTRLIHDHHISLPSKMFSFNSSFLKFHHSIKQRFEYSCLISCRRRFVKRFVISKWSHAICSCWSGVVVHIHDPIQSQIGNLSSILGNMLPLSSTKGDELIKCQRPSMDEGDSWISRVRIGSMSN